MNDAVCKLVGWMMQYCDYHMLNHMYTIVKIDVVVESIGISEEEYIISLSYSIVSMHAGRAS